MAKLEWGKKRICPVCSLKYYDFNKSPIMCPSCNHEFDTDTYIKSRKGKNISSKTIAENNDDISDLNDIVSEDDIAEGEDVESDESDLLDISKQDDTDAEEEININEDLTFIEDEDLNEVEEISDNEVDEEIIDNKEG